MKRDPFQGAPDNLIDGLARAGSEFARSTLTLVDGRGRVAGQRTFSEIVEAAQLHSRRLRTWGVAPGDRVVICLSTSFEWYDCWMGSLIAGALPVAMAPPGALGSPKQQVDKVIAAAQQIGASRVIAGDAVLREIASRSPLELEFRSAEQVAACAPAAPEQRPVPQPEDIAFLQMTSGSTGHQRAGHLSHETFNR